MEFKILTQLSIIQSELKAPKTLLNSFMKFNYRSCENILEALKPLLLKTKTCITLTDDIITIQNKFFVKSTATLQSSETTETISTTAFAEMDTKLDQKMSLSQLTGACSSYARKYALNGLFAIDDNKDADYLTDKEKPIQPIKQYEQKPIKQYESKPKLTSEVFFNILEEIKTNFKDTDEIILKQKILEKIKQKDNLRENINNITKLSDIELQLLKNEIIEYINGRL